MHISCPSRAPAALRLLVLLATATPVFAASSQPSQAELGRMSIEELMRIDVTIAGRREEPIGTTAAAVSVITGDDIRRAGVTTLADALQLADGVHVARLSVGTWRISSRGFNGNTPNKLLVMIDGRTVYSPLFAGVFWNAVDYPLEDIERIEVIRGPGATLWGANAVNGVINIITRHTRDTQGSLVTLSAGNEDPTLVEARYGGRAGAATWRAYGKFALRDAQRLATGGSAEDGRRRELGGFRLDSPAGLTTWLIKGDLFHSRDDFLGRPSGTFTDVALQGQWTRTLAGGSRVELSAFYHREDRDAPGNLFHQIDRIDVDGQHAWTAGTRHALVWGGGIRGNWDRTETTPALRFEPAQRQFNLLNVFVQDEIAVLPGRLFATVGIKYERNDFSGGELQPNVRARLQLGPRQMLWGAVSRAVRRPSRIDDDVVAPGTGPPVVRGTGEFEAEKLVAAEAGYRLQPATFVSFDATVFHHDVDDLRSQDAPPGGGLPLTLGNTLQGRSYGVELGVNLQPAARWRTHVGITRLTTEITPQPGSRDVSGGQAEANDPSYFFNVRSGLDLPHRLEVDVLLRGVGALPNPHVPAYTELGARLGWTARPGVSIWVVGHDLLHDRHPEAGADTPLRVEFERAVRAGLTVRF